MLYRTHRLPFNPIEIFINPENLILNDMSFKQPLQLTIFDLELVNGKNGFKKVNSLKEDYFKSTYNLDKKVFLSMVEEKYGKGDFKKIKEALEFAENIHVGQTRETGETYMVHPLAVAKYIADFGFNANTVITALLHDVIEDGNIKTSVLRKKFGRIVTSSVVLLTKPKLCKDQWVFADNPKYCICDDDYKNLDIEQKIKMYEERNSVYYPRIYESGSFIPFFVKIFDNIHNVETCEIFHEKKQLRTLRITATYSLLHMSKLLGLNNEKLKKILEMLENKIEDFNLKDYVGKIKHSKPIVKLPPRIDKSRKMFLEMPFPEMENISVYGDPKTGYLMGFIEIGFPKKDIDYVDLLLKRLNFLGFNNEKIVTVKSELPSEVGASEKMVKIKLCEPKIEFKRNKIYIKNNNLKVNSLSNIDVVEEDSDYRQIKMLYDEIIKALNEIHKQIKSNTN